MKLKTLEIYAFKSFADRVKLTFSPGITAVVGPNGCGKSNLVEAFPWVFGEQAVKSLRGNKMADLIFSGPQRKNPSMAEVSITLTEIDGCLPLPFEEVCITRRLQRNGTSEYFINGKNVRLKDVHDLFIGSGLGKNTLFIFEQGKMDEIIHYTPTERRIIFEGVAGTSRLMQKREEALKKIELLIGNLARIDDIIREVERQLAVSERQAVAALAYKKAKERLDFLEKERLAIKWRQLQQRYEAHMAKELAKERELEAESQKANELQISAAGGAEEVEKSEVDLKMANEKYFELSSQRKICLQQLSSLQERLNELLNRQKSCTADQQNSSHIRSEITQSQKELAVLQQKNGEIEKNAQEVLSAHRELYEEKTVQLQELRCLFNDLQSRLMKQMEAEKKGENEIKQISLRSENCLERLSHILLRKEKLDQAVKEIESETAGKKKAVATLTSSIQMSQEKVENLEFALGEYEEKIQSMQKELERLRKDHTAATSRQELLIQLKKEYEGASSGCKKLLEAGKSKNSPLFGKIALLSDILPIPAKIAKESALHLRHYASTLVVDDLPTLYALLSYAEEKKLSDFSVFCKEFAEEKTKGGKALDSFLEGHTDPLFCHFFKEASHISSVKEAIEKKFAGEVSAGRHFIIDRKKTVFHLSIGERSPFLRESELKELEKFVEENSTKLQKMNGQLSEAIFIKEEKNNEKKVCEQAMRTAEMKLVEQNYSLQRALSDFEKAKKEMAALLEEESKVANEKKLLDEREKEALIHYTQALNLFRSCNVEMESKKAELEENEAMGKREKELLRKKEEQWQQSAEEKKRIEHALQIAALKLQQALQKEQKIEQELLEAAKGIKELSEREAIVKENYGQLELALEASEKEKGACGAALSAKKSEIQNKNVLIQKQRRRCNEIGQEIHGSKIVSAQLETAKKNVEEQIIALFNVEAEQIAAALLASPSGLSLPSVEKELSQLTRELENAGDINLAAIEESKLQRERHTELSLQTADIRTAQQELEQIILGLERESRHLFTSAFQQIRLSFKKNFEILFEGGEADLAMEGDDSLTCGINISAKPPGKQMRPIQMLSGGEKCLTAMALLFAIFEVKPAPFCILDEIDAPLDDANVERFGRVLKQFIDKSQFIVITHNKRTMALADVLFGISMEEKGVSKVLSMEFNSGEKQNVSANLKLQGACN